MLWMMGILWIHHDVTQGRPRNRVSKNEEKKKKKKWKRRRRRMKTEKKRGTAHRADPEDLTHLKDPVSPRR